MSTTIKAYFNNFEKHDSGDHVIYTVPSENIIELGKDGTIKLWSRNRPADDIRVEEIRAYIDKTKHVDGTIRLAFIKGEGFVCYESNHRRLALVPGILVIVDILWDVDQDRVIEEFTHINRAVPVPDLYTAADMDATAKLEIIKYVDKMKEKYHAFCKPSARPHKPGFNRDTLAGNITRIWKDIGCPVTELLAAIDRLNEEYKTGERMDHSKIKPDVLEKCKNVGLWLFAIKQELNEDHIKEVLISG